MHNMKITHIVETDSLSKLKSCQLRETYVKTKHQKYVYQHTMQKLHLRLLKIQIL